jgi:hypothetical protein
MRLPEPPLTSCEEYSPHLLASAAATARALARSVGDATLVNVGTDYCEGVVSCGEAMRTLINTSDAENGYPVGSAYSCAICPSKSCVSTIVAALTRMPN